MYAVQIESLEDFQKKLTAILDSLEQDQSVMTMSDGTSTFGDFPEAQEFSTTYEQTKQDLVNAFNEVTQLVNTMISVVGTNAAKYQQTEQDITAKFNSILQQYGDAPLPAGGTSGTTVYAQKTTGSTYSMPLNTPTVGPGTTTVDTGTTTGSGTTTNPGTGTTTTSTTGSGNTSAGAA
ncbi:MAG: hypothetical protein ACRDVE_10575 [Actinocrinis sp.]